MPVIRNTGIHFNEKVVKTFKAEIQSYNPLWLEQSESGCNLPWSGYNFDPR